MRLLVVEDDPDLAEALIAGLRADGYAVDGAASVAAAVDLLGINHYDLVVLDLGLPDGDGLEVCRRLRSGELGSSSSARVLMLTARDQLESRIAGLDTGADDYVVKPVDFGELAARVRALSRRDLGAGSAVIEVGDLRLDAAARSASRAGRELGLTVKEFALLRYFALHPGEVLSAEELLEHVWDANADPFSNVVRVTISNLRRKLTAGGEATQPIETVVGAGYRLGAPRRRES